MFDMTFLCCSIFSLLSKYYIPKNIQLLVNIWAIGWDSEVWEGPLVFNPDRFITRKGARSACGSTECVHRQQRRPRYQRPRPCTRPVARAAASSDGRSLVCHVKRPRHAVVVVRKRRPRAGLPQVAVAARPDAAQTDAGRHEQVTWPCRPQPCVGGRTGRSHVLVTTHAPATTVGEEIRVRAFLQ
ncbi:hypothetical protein B296_00033744 [Ensete ventricosum]|uniref:Uncharacterized protein n=1 Tax=Ensete ventricosum TaxID=4639 RepID=A0A426X494_ENSVE|nr:hypothetical protein B296_00033744 [Ensete ventricosum]